PTKQSDHVFDREQRDEDSGDQDWRVADSFGNSQGGDRAAARGGRHRGTPGEQREGKHDGENINDKLAPDLGSFRKRHHQRIQADVTGVAHSGRGAEHGHRNYQQQGDLLDIGWSIVEDVAQDDAVDNDDQQASQAGARQVHRQVEQYRIQCRQPSGERFFFDANSDLDLEFLRAASKFHSFLRIAPRHGNAASSKQN